MLSHTSRVINTKAVALTLGIVPPRNALQAVAAFNGSVQGLLGLGDAPRETLRKVSALVRKHAASCEQLCSVESVELVRETVGLLEVCGRLL
jgi:hypothetical protein